MRPAGCIFAVAPRDFKLFGWAIAAPVTTNGAATARKAAFQLIDEFFCHFEDWAETTQLTRRYCP